MNAMVPIEHEIYARWLDWGTRLGLGVLTACFIAYVLELVDPLVPPQELTRLWALPVNRYLSATGAPTGWGWLRLLDKGDYLNLIGIGVLALITVACYARMVPLLFKRGERLQAWLAIAQVIVLLTAASGLFDGSH